MIATIVTALLATTVGTPPAAPTRPARPTLNDPSRRICETIKITGSRLGRQRVCMTAAEWSEERRQTRQGVERLQVRGLRDRE
jgi:hypothetical protein